MGCFFAIPRRFFAIRPLDPLLSAMQFLEALIALAPREEQNRPHNDGAREQAEQSGENGIHALAVNSRAAAPQVREPARAQNDTRTPP